MADENLFDEQFARELELMQIYLSTKAGRSALTIDEFIESRLTAGVPLAEIERALIDDLRNNGRIFSELRRSIKSTATGSINRVRDVGYFSEFTLDRQYRWSAILVNTCADCLERHGRSMLWEEWERAGLPRTGATVCRENCHCVLVPSEFTEIEPIRRKKK